jgi:hypothetical protein
MAQETRGRKRKDLPTDKVFGLIALTLESGEAKSKNAATTLAVRYLKISSATATEASIITRLRKRFAEIEPELRAWARKKLDEKKVAPPTYRSPIPPSIGVGRYDPKKR